MPICPECQSERTVKNGHIHNGKQRFKCKSCGRQFVESPRQKRISQETIALVDRLLSEGLSHAAIARAAEVSASWVESHLSQRLLKTPPKH